MGHSANRFETRLSGENKNFEGTSRLLAYRHQLEAWCQWSSPASPFLTVSSPGGLERVNAWTLAVQTMYARKNPSRDNEA